MPPIPPTPIKIAVLDDYQSFSPTIFSTLPSTSFHTTVFNSTIWPTSSENLDAIIARLKPFTIISTMRERTPFPADLLSNLPNLKLLLTTGTRNAALDLEACKKLGITVAGTTNKSKGAGPDSTTQHTVALILALARNIAQDDYNMKANAGWQSTFATGVSGKTFGVIGLGRLGVAVAKIMHLAFGMRIICWSENLTQEGADERARNAGLTVEREDGEKVFKVVSKEELFKSADVVSVHYVLSERSRGIVGAGELALMKKDALLVNTSRGPLVNEGALLDVLKGGKIGGAALDVYETEPLPGDSEWRSLEWGTGGRARVVLSPHMGYVQEEVLRGWYGENVQNIQKWVEGKELSCVMA